MATYKLKIQGNTTNVNVEDGLLLTTSSATGTLYPFEYKGTKTNLNVKAGKLVIIKK